MWHWSGKSYGDVGVYGCISWSSVFCAALDFELANFPMNCEPSFLFIILCPACAVDLGGIHGINWCVIALVVVRVCILQR